MIGSLGAAYSAREQSIQPHPQEVHLKNIRQLTFMGENAEAYFSFDGKRVIFQSTREPYKCDQIFTMNQDGSNVKLVSTGKGRTTCGYFTPDGKRIIYASTHLGSPDCPPPADRSQGYVWPIYRTWDIFSANIDGTQQRRLTNELGYDGGPWHSQDGQWIVWRASRPKTPDEIAKYKDLFSKNLVMPAKLEIYVMRADGSQKRQLTSNGTANFAPYFHPNGRQIIFASNMKDPRGGNFDL